MYFWDRLRAAGPYAFEKSFEILRHNDTTPTLLFARLLCHVLVTSENLISCVCTQKIVVESGMINLLMISNWMSYGRSKFFSIENKIENDMILH